MKISFKSITLFSLNLFFLLSLSTITPWFHSPFDDFEHEMHRMMRTADREIQRTKREIERTEKFLGKAEQADQISTKVSFDNDSKILSVTLPIAISTHQVSTLCREGICKISINQEGLSLDIRINQDMYNVAVHSERAEKKEEKNARASNASSFTTSQKQYFPYKVDLRKIGVAIDTNTSTLEVYLPSLDSEMFEQQIPVREK